MARGQLPRGACGAERRLAGRDACTGVPAAVLAGSGLPAAAEGYAHWSCRWRSVVAGTSLTVVFRLADDVDLDNCRDIGSSHGYELYTQAAARRCRVRLTGPAPGPMQAQSAIEVTIDDHRPHAACRSALRVARATAAHLPA